MEEVIFGSNTPERAAAATASHKSWWTLSRECHVKIFFWSSEVLSSEVKRTLLATNSCFFETTSLHFCTFLQLFPNIAHYIAHLFAHISPIFAAFLFVQATPEQKKKFDILLCRCLLGTKLFFLPLLSIVSHPTITSRLPFNKQSWVPVKTLR